MKLRLLIIILTTAAVGLFNTSCASSPGITIRSWRVVTLKELLKMPPFNATVEDLDISHPFMLYTAVDIYLRKAKGGYRLDLQFSPANKFIVGFAHSLHKEQCYAFPQVFADYVNNQSINNHN